MVKGFERTHDVFVSASWRSTAIRLCIGVELEKEYIVLHSVRLRLSDFDT